MAKLRARGRHRWEVVVELPRDDGKRRQVSRIFHGHKRDAEDFGCRLEVEVQEGQHSTGRRTVGDLLEEWWRIGSPRWSPSTARQDRGIIDNHLTPRLGELELRRLTPYVIDRLYSDLLAAGLAPATIARIHGTLHRALAQGRVWRWVADNAASDATKPPLEDGEPEVPSPKTVLALLTLAEKKDAALALFLLLAVVTGARLGELCALRWGDWDGAGGLLIDSSMVDAGPGVGMVEKDTKTRKKGRRLLGLTPRATEALRAHRLRCAEQALAGGAHLDEHDWVFEAPRRRGQPWRPDTTDKRFAHLRDELDAPHFVFNALRHWTGTYLTDEGVPLPTVARVMGHAKTSTTSDIYVQAVDARDAQVVEVLTRLVG